MQFFLFFLCCHYLSCTLHSRTLSQAGMLQHKSSSLTLPSVVKSVHISLNDSPHRPPLRTLLPTYPSLSHFIFKPPLSSASGKSHRSKHLSEASLPHVCVMLVSFWIANDKWRFKVKSYQRTWQLRALKKANNGALDWLFWRSHRQFLLIHKAASFPSDGFGWVQWV